MVLVEPENEKTMAISTSHILDLIETHASSAALIILSGVQYLSGQLLDMKKITSCARSKGMVVGWDLAHAVGNVELRLHEWDVDFAVWCNYKYMNSGPGAIGSSFVHQRHGGVDGNEGYRPRLAGWWGNDMKNRFQMQNCMYSHTLKSILLLISDFAFSPSVGAAGYQISNPSILDIVALIASLEVFNLTDMSSIRHKSVLLTGYLQYLLQEMCPSPFQIMTSSRASERGAQLSLRFEDVHTLDNVMDKLRKLGIVVAQKQDVMRIAPVPMYNTFTEVWEFVDELHRAVSSVGE
jgi:kynureninase